MATKLRSGERQREDTYRECKRAHIIWPDLKLTYASGLLFFFRVTVRERERRPAKPRGMRAEAQSLLLFSHYNLYNFTCFLAARGTEERTTTARGLKLTQRVLRSWHGPYSHKLALQYNGVRSTKSPHWFQCNSHATS